MLSRRTALMGALGTLAFAETQGARARPTEPLKVWINGDKGYHGIEQMGAAFERETGVPVQVEHPEDSVSRFERASAAGRGPDIWIWPQDRAGSWAASGLIRPVAPSRRSVEAISEQAWSAWRLGGRTWAWPIGIDAVALLVNTDLVPRPPTTWEEVFEIDRRLRPQGRRAIMWPFNEFFYAYGMVSAFGGYAFGRRADGSWDPKDSGIDNTGSRQGMRLLKRMVDEGLVPRTVNYAESEAAMGEGRVAMTINGPWGWNNLRRSGLRLVAAPLPGTAGSPGRPMVTVLGAMITSNSRQPWLAAEFIENWMLTERGLLAMHEHVAIGVPAHRALAARVCASDPLVAGTLAAATPGHMIPNIPEMSRYWLAMNTAVQTITQGRETVETALARAARRVAADGVAP